MKRAALAILVSLALASEAFAVLRPRFPMKPEPPPFRGGAIIMNHDSDFVILEDDGIRQVIPGISSKYFVSSSEAGKTQIIYLADSTASSAESTQAVMATAWLLCGVWPNSCTIGLRL